MPNAHGQSKKTPAYHDDDLMPFGKYKGKMMIDVPANYLLWLHEQGCNNEMVRNYIINSMDAIEQELE